MTDDAGGQRREGLAFVLSGGSASGAVQVGMLRALSEAGIQPDVVVGTSVGAVNGVMVARDPIDGWRRLAEVWRRLDRADVVGSNRSLKTLSCLVRTRRHLFESDGLRALIRDNLDVDTFEELPVPLVAVATNARTGVTERLDRGRLEPALLASAAIPGAFPPVEIGEEWYFDGGVTANVPVRQALEVGAETVIVMDTAPAESEREPATNIAGTIQHALSVMMRSQTSNQVEEPSTTEVIRLPAATPGGIGVFDFTQTEALIERGFCAAAAFLAEHPIARTLDNRMAV